MDVADALAENAAKIDFGDLPAEAVEATKKDILDTLGSLLAAKNAPGCPQLLEMIKEWGGKPECTIIGDGARVPSPNAAWVNAATAHALDYDDTFEVAAPLHAGVSVVPACLAAAELARPTSGRDFVAAIALGIDLMGRLSLATIKGLRGWHLTSVYGYFGAAMGAAKILGLDQKGIVNSLGVAYAQAAGNVQANRDGALTKRMQAGFASRGGLLGALMTRKGVTGARNIFQGQAGLFNTYHRGEYDAGALTQELGKEFYVSQLSFKPWPCCRYNHSYLTATLSLVNEHDIRPEEVEQVVVEPDIYLCHPLEVKRKPPTIVDAQFSLPYVVSAAIVHRGVFIKHFTGEAIQDSRLLDLAMKVVPRENPDIADDVGKKITPAIVDIVTRRGTFSKRVEVPYGHPANPMSVESLVDKFRDCVSWAGNPKLSQNSERLIQMITSLEEVKDMSELIELAS